VVVITIAIFSHFSGKIIAVKVGPSQYGTAERGGQYKKVFLETGNSGKRTPKGEDCTLTLKGEPLEGFRVHSWPYQLFRENYGFFIWKNSSRSLPDRKAGHPRFRKCGWKKR
jgi:hypothetical protein